MPRGTDRYDEARLQGRLWTPASLAPCVWFDAMDLSTFTLDGSGNVSQWSDKSGTGNNAAQATSGKRPTYVALGRNSRPSVRFLIANATRLDLSVTGFPTGTTDHTLCAVYYAPTGIGAYMQCFAWGDVGFPSGRVRSLLSTDTDVLNFNMFAIDHNTSVAVGTDHVITHTFVGSSGASSLYIDGAAASTATLGAASTTTFGASIGGAPSNGSGFDDYLTGDVQEIILVPRLLGLSDVNSLTGYAAWKWGYVSKLAASHPFKNRPPLIGA